MEIDAYVAPSAPAAAGRPHPQTRCSAGKVNLFESAACGAFERHRGIRTHQGYTALIDQHRPASR